MRRDRNCRQRLIRPRLRTIRLRLRLINLFRRRNVFTNSSSTIQVSASSFDWNNREIFYLSFPPSALLVLLLWRLSDLRHLPDIPPSPSDISTSVKQQVTSTNQYCSPPLHLTAFRHPRRPDWSLSLFVSVITCSVLSTSHSFLRISFASAQIIDVFMCCCLGMD
ncbi:hypothetical protein BD310DRAFT_930530 [Dichomitus squalens]|uniref:Uncharacterized protein n=1 Tax=Dichomitus squalens TaxID=114155 RepID=A0A4V2K7P7_9APHY|nr:hypothetical protein BD310DRAFT_930530 [Dichomitus squalens]